MSIAADERIDRARQARDDIMFDQWIDRKLDMLFSAKTVGPDARFKLRHLLKHYARFPHPFTQCVRDNRKRFGPGSVERICATIVDLIKGTTKWRHGRQTANMSDEFPPPPEIDDEVVALLDNLDGPSQQKLQAIYMEAVEVAS